jgi:hypothetical protein
MPLKVQMLMKGTIASPSSLMILRQAMGIVELVVEGTIVFRGILEMCSVLLCISLHPCNVAGGCCPAKGWKGDGALLALRYSIVRSIFLLTFP